MKYFEILIANCIFVSIIIYFFLGTIIFISCMTLLYPIYTFEFDLELLISKNFIYFTCQFLINFVKTNTNTNLVTSLNKFNIFFGIYGL